MGCFIKHQKLLCFGVSRAWKISELLLHLPRDVRALGYDTFGLAVPNYAHIIDYMIAYRLNQSDTERSGGFVSRILKKERTLLDDDILQALSCCSLGPAP